MSTLTGESQKTIVLLDEAGGGTVTLLPADRDQFCLSVEDAIKGCKAIAATYSVVQQVADLRDKLAVWIERRRSAIQAAYLSFRRDGILFVVVQRGVAKDEQLAADLTDLDLAIASDESCNSLIVEVLSIPSASSSATSAFLSSGRVQEYAGPARSRDSREGEPEGTPIHPHQG
jgi:hypothetical protein